MSPSSKLTVVQLAPSFRGLRPASVRASSTARAASKKIGTRCEVLLQSELAKSSVRFETNADDLPGNPDIVFRRNRVAVFIDGDFWHGRNLRERLARLARGHNSAYWLSKIETNVRRDRRNVRRLRSLGWVVLRVWESEVHRDPAGLAAKISKLITRGARKAASLKRRQLT